MPAPPLPPGFTIDAVAGSGGSSHPPLPPGFQLDAAPQQQLPEKTTGNGFLADAVGSFGAGFNKFVNPILRAPERLVAKGADLAASAGIPVPRSMTSAGLQHVYDAQEQGGPMGTQVAPNSTGRWSEAAGNAVGQGLAMSAIPAMGAPEALATAAPRIAQGGVSGVGEAIARGAQELASRPGSLGGLLANTESNAVAGSTGQAVAEKMGEPYRAAGEMVGGAAPAFFPSMIAGKVLGKVIGGPSKIAGSVLPESPTFDVRQAERQAYLNREQSPSGVDYADPKAADPSRKMGLGESIMHPIQKADEAKTRVQDWGSGIRRENAESLIAKQFQRAMEDASTRQSAADSKSAQDAIPGFKPTLAESLNDPELLLQQQKFERGMSGDELAGRQAAKDANVAAVRDYGDSRVAPAGHALPGESADETVGRTARDITTSRDAAAAMPQAQAEQGVRDLTKSLPDVPAQQTGAQIRKGYDAGKEAAGEVTGQKKAAIFDEAGSTRFPADRLNSGIKQDMAKLGTDLLPEELPPAVRKVLGNTETATAPKTGQEALLPKPAPEAPSFSAEDLLSARQQLGEQIRGLQNGTVSTSDGNKLARLKAVRARLDAEWQNLGEDGSNVRGAVDDFNQHYRDNVVPNYRQGLGEDITTRQANGEPKISDKGITDKLTSPNSVDENVQNLRVNPTGPAREATKTANLDAMRQDVVDPKTGMIKPGGVKAYIAQNRDRLAADPEMKSILKAKDPDAHYKLMEIADKERQGIKDGPLNEQFGGPRSDTRAIDDAISDPQKMRALKAEAADNPDLDAALKRAAWERVMTNPGENITDDVKRSTFNILYGDNPQHLRDLKTISDAVAINARTPRAKGEATAFKPPVAGALQDLTGSSASSTLNKIWGLNTGRTSKSWTAIDQGLRVVNRMTERDYDRALKEAIFNPKVAEVLAAGVKNGGPTPMMRDKLGNLMNLGKDDTRAPSQPMQRIGIGAEGRSDDTDQRGQ